MAGVPLLFGRPGRRCAFGWSWKRGQWRAYLEPGACGDSWHYVEIRIETKDAIFDVLEHGYRTQATALRALERELTRMAAGLSGLGVPRV